MYSCDVIGEWANVFLLCCLCATVMSLENGAMCSYDVVNVFLCYRWRMEVFIAVRAPFPVTSMFHGVRLACYMVLFVLLQDRVVSARSGPV